MKIKLTFLIVVLIIISLTFLGCKAELTERIAELEEQLAEEDKASQKELSEVEEEEAPPVMVTITKETEEEATDEGEVADEEETEEEVDVDKEAPTINLAIFEGPTLDGGICYYRIEATVTGNPIPSVSFSKDDSGGAWGANKTQINLNDPSDAYTLTATATNSEDSAMDSITLSWGCEVPEPDPGPKEKTVDIVADTTISGDVAVGHSVNPGIHELIVGDIIAGVNKELQLISFLSFDISSIISLDDVTIKDVSVTIPVNNILGNPEQLGPAYIYVFYYGNSLDDGPLPLFGGELVKTINITGSTNNFSFSSSKLKDELQKRVDRSKYLFQLKIALSIGTNDNDKSDYYKILSDSVILHVKYEVPG